MVYCIFRSVSLRKGDISIAKMQIDIPHVTSHARADQYQYVQHRPTPPRQAVFLIKQINEFLARPIYQKRRDHGACAPSAPLPLPAPPVSKSRFWFPGSLFRRSRTETPCVASLVIARHGPGPAAIYPRPETHQQRGIFGKRRATLMIARRRPFVKRIPHIPCTFPKSRF